MPTTTPTARSGSRYDVEERLIRRYHERGDVAARTELVERLMPLVRHIARRYADRGEPLEDLVQVGCIGLLKGIDRFDPQYGSRLISFVAPNVAGEIKRHFRDRGWSIRVPRDVQELHAKLSGATDKLTTRLGRSPTIEELAKELDVSVERVVEALQGGRHYTTMSLDETVTETGTLLDALGEEDDGFRLAEHRALITDGMGMLAEREQTILRLRFYEGLTQQEIGERVGISQMHVSRLLRQSLEQLHDALAEQDDFAAAPPALPARTRRAA